MSHKALPVFILACIAFVGAGCVYQKAEQPIPVRPVQPVKPIEAPTSTRPIGGDKDAHGCLIAAGYRWCVPKQKCMRFWEEPCFASDEEEVRNALSEEHGRPLADVNLKVTQKDATHMVGSVSFGPNPGEGGMLLAVKQDNIWSIVYEGNGQAPCAELIGTYAFPKPMLKNFCD